MLNTKLNVKNMNDLKILNISVILIMIINSISSLCGLIYWIVNWNVGSVFFHLIGLFFSALCLRELIKEYKEEYK